MLYKFITTEDIQVSIKDAILEQILGSNTTIAPKAANWAIDEIYSKLSQRFDMAAVFFLITTWNNSKAYVLDDVVYSDGKLYKCLVANTDKIPASNTTEWVEDDSRSQMILEKVITLFIFFVYRRINPRKVPKTVRDDYNDVMTWLENVIDRKETPNLPSLEDGADIIPYKSNPKISHYY